MKRFFIAAAFVAALPAGVLAQVGKQVEVTKTYVLSLESAVKLPVRPDMTDTVKMYPEIDYSITPLSLETSFRTRPIRPASVTYWEFNRPLPCYVKAGAGYPLNSVVDFYVSTQNAATGYAVGYLNHEGRYADIRNTFGDKFNSVRLLNRIGAAAGKYFGRHVVEGEVSYDNRLYHRYGRHTPSGAAFSALPRPGAVVDYGDANFALRVGDDFQNLDRFNFEVAVHGGLFFDHSDVAERARQSGFGGSAKIARAFGEHRFSLEAGYEWLDGSKNLSGRQQQIRAAARYGRDGEVVRFVVGADYCHDRMKGEENGNYILPYARVDFKLGAREFKPFVEVDGEVHDNSFRSLTRLNPYVAEGTWLGKSSVDYNVRLGLGGALWHNRFDYRVYVAFSIHDNHLYWTGNSFADRQNSWFSGFLTPDLSRQTVGSLHGELIYRPVSQLQIDLGLHGYLYNDERVFKDYKRIELGNGDPQFRGNAAVRYRGRKIACGLTARAESRRSWSLFTTRGEGVVCESFSAPFSVDLGVDFEWKISGRVSLFAEGRNLLDRRLYVIPWYPEYRVSCTAGAKVQF